MTITTEVLYDVRRLEVDLQGGAMTVRAGVNGTPVPLPPTQPTPQPPQPDPQPDQVDRPWEHEVDFLGGYLIRQYRMTDRTDADRATLAELISLLALELAS